MFCRNCGKEVDTEKCPYCGHDSSAPQTPENNSVFDEIPDGNKSGNNVFNEVPNINPNYVNYYNNNTANPAYLQNPSLNLGWFKFLINFLLIFSAIANVLAVSYILLAHRMKLLRREWLNSSMLCFPH